MFIRNLSEAKAVYIATDSNIIIIKHDGIAQLGVVGMTQRTNAAKAQHVIAAPIVGK